MNKQEQAIFNDRVKAVVEILQEKTSLATAEELAKQIVRGADGGSELGDFNAWLENRFIPQTVWLTSDDYTRGMTRALPQALKFVNSDFGSSKQRDFGQLWTDTARGLLGEIAVQLFFQQMLGVEIKQDLTLNKQRANYIDTDIETIKEVSGEYRLTKLNTSIKTGKFNARWLDEYSAAKINNIHAFIFVRLGMPHQHFISYLKDASFLKTKLFPQAVKIGEMTDDMSDELWNQIPSFEPIPAYIAGFLIRSDLNYPIDSVYAEIMGNANYRGRDTRKIYIKRGVGVFTRSNLYNLPAFQELDPEQRLKIIIEGIEKEIDNKDHFYANTGSFRYGTESWKNFVTQL